jgi:metal-responsive CopG/Arc/MetJ family transcriptional regulator
MSKKPNQVAFTLGEDNIKLLDNAFKKYDCSSRSELLKKIIENWIFSNKPFIMIKNGR